VTATSAADIVLIAAAVIWILIRQLRTAPVKPRLLLLAPLVLAWFGVRAVPRSLWQDAADVALLALSGVVSAALGVWRGRTIAVWRDAEGTWLRRGSTLTLILWGALVAVRGVLYLVDRAAGHTEASGTGALLITLALGFAAQNAVIALRISPPARTFTAVR
jgi:hypothetical protein